MRHYFHAKKCVKQWSCYCKCLKHDFGTKSVYTLFLPLSTALFSRGLRGVWSDEYQGWGASTAVKSVPVPIAWPRMTTPSRGSFQVTASRLVV